MLQSSHHSSSSGNSNWVFWLRVSTHPFPPVYLAHPSSLQALMLRTLLETFTHVGDTSNTGCSEIRSIATTRRQQPGLPPTYYLTSDLATRPTRFSRPMRPVSITQVPRCAHCPLPGCYELRHPQIMHCERPHTQLWESLLFSGVWRFPCVDLRPILFLPK